MQKVVEEFRFFTLWRDEETDDYFLEVLCGTIATYELRLKLNDEEKADYLKNKASIKSLAQEIEDAPRTFFDRHILTGFNQ